MTPKRPFGKQRPMHLLRRGELKLSYGFGSQAGTRKGK